MQEYQEEYIANVKEYISLNLRPEPEDQTPEEYARRLQAQCIRRRELEQRNMQLLREKLLPDLDHLSDADEVARRDLQEFSDKLLANPTEVDVGLLCQIQQTFVNQARQEDDRRALIEHLYWLGRARNSLSSKLVNMEANGVAPAYYALVRECFEEVASYLGEFEQIEDKATRGYIIRALANRALGRFPTVGERTRRLKEALGVMENSYYRELEPTLPWDQYVKMTHRLMVASISHSNERAMTSKDVADIMRSVYIVYRGAEPSAQQVFHCSAVEFYCGVHSLDYHLEQIRGQLDAADNRDFSPAGCFAIISLSAYYCLYLSQRPGGQLGKRDRFYLTGLYRRVQAYLDAFPPEKENENMFFYLRQLICTFIELEQAIPYRDFLLRLIRHFSPEIYSQSCAVAEAAKVLCGYLLDRDGGFFDDIPFLRDISDPAGKRKAVLEYAEGCGLFHDAGKVNCLEIHTRIARRWFPIEDDMARLHVLSGHNMLITRQSTSRYASAALGHHAWYNGNTVLGYPATYQRDQCPERRMVDVIALTHWLVNRLNEYQIEPVAVCALEQVAERACALSGRQFSPKVVDLLREEPVRAALGQALENSYQTACREIFRER